MSLEPLCLGIKRGEFRANDASSKQADAVFGARRDTSLRASSYRCVRCGYESAADLKTGRKSNLQVHHLDDDHHNNEPDNLAPHCSLDHAYHHCGCDAKTPGGSEGWASKMRISYLPELSPEDSNNLQRACGAALSSETEAEVAMEIIGMLGVLCGPVKDVFGSFHAKDFAAAFSKMSDVEYQQRHDYVDGLRVNFHPDTLRQVGQDFLEDARLFPVKSWEGVANGLGIS